MTEEVKQVNLKVLEAYTRDIGRGVLRADYDAMDALDTSIGDFVILTGKKKTAAKVLPLYPSDEGRGVTRLDGIIRLNAGLSIGDTVKIVKSKASPATHVIIKHNEEKQPHIDTRYFSDALEQQVIMSTDILSVPYFGTRVSFQIVSIEPANQEVSIITSKTIFDIEGQTIPRSTQSPQPPEPKTYKEYKYAHTLDEANSFSKEGYHLEGWVPASTPEGVIGIFSKVVKE